MNYLITFCTLVLLSFTTCQAETEFKLQNSNEEQNYVELSAKLLQSIIDNKPTTEIEKKLQSVSVDFLSNQLKTDIEKKVFWINIYNSYIQLLLSKEPSLYENRGAFFKEEIIVIAGKALSFDNIEHGIIRSSKIKLSLGLLRNPFVGNYEKTFRTKVIDERIHFALNCGAKSCPLVAVYEVNGFDQKIDAVAKNFLDKTTTYKSEEDAVYITSLFSWFRGDFGGMNGVIKFLKKYNQIPNKSNPNINFTTYDWTLSLGNYYDE
tara:strand:- start:1345 stop:2136 length:792 start_codon:yes stop_codon:yes gene_type:complete